MFGARRRSLRGEYVELNVEDVDVHVGLTGEIKVVCVRCGDEQESVGVEEGEFREFRYR